MRVTPPGSCLHPLDIKSWIKLWPCRHSAVARTWRWKLAVESKRPAWICDWSQLGIAHGTHRVATTGTVQGHGNDLWWRHGTPETRGVVHCWQIPRHTSLSASLSCIFGWLRGTVVERRSLTGELSVLRSTCSWRVTTYMWINRPL